MIFDEMTRGIVVKTKYHKASLASFESGDAKFDFLAHPLHAPWYDRI